MVTMTWQDPEAVDIARLCLNWGARLSTTSLLTGLNRHTLKRMAKSLTVALPQGRPEDCSHWYLLSDVLGRIEACIFVSAFRRLRAEKFGLVDSLVSAYRHVFEVAQKEPQLGFDHAFSLAGQSAGLWKQQPSSLDMCSCPGCHHHFISHFMSPVKSVALKCPFCELLRPSLERSKNYSTFPTGVPCHEQD